MPTTTIPTIARTNTIDEWRIQTNRSASDLNDLGFGTYEKDEGTLIVSETASLTITAEGTPLQVANNVLFQKDLTLSQNLLLGVESSATGNIIAGGTVEVNGPGRSFTVANNALVSNDLEVAGDIYVENVYANTNVNITGSSVIDGLLYLSNVDDALIIPTGNARIDTVISSEVDTQGANVDAFYATYAKIEVLDTLPYAEIITLQNTQANVYYLRSNTTFANTSIIRNLTANQTGNIVTLISNDATINTGTITAFDSDTSNITNSTIGTIYNELLQADEINANTANATLALIRTSNISTINANTGNVTLVLSTTANISTVNANTANATLALIRTSNVNLINANTANISNVSITRLDVEQMNVTNNLTVQTGNVRIEGYTSSSDALVVTQGTTRLLTTVIEAPLTVTGKFTQTGEVALQVDTLTLNDGATLNKNANIVNERPDGTDAKISWNEVDDWWEVSTGDTWNSMYKILDRADINDTTTGTSTTEVASARVLKVAFDRAVGEGVYSNGVSAIQNTNITSVISYANSAFRTQNTSGVYANTAYMTANSAQVYANAAYATANTALVAGGQIAGGYANAAYVTANTALLNVNTGASLYANSAYFMANVAVADAATAQGAADKAQVDALSAGVYANSAYLHANSAYISQNTTGVYANAAYTLSNTAIVKGTTGSPLVGTSTQTLYGSLTLAGDGAKLSTPNVSFDNTGTVFFTGKQINFNTNQNQNQGSTDDITINFDRGNKSNTYFSWLETQTGRNADVPLWRIFTNDKTFSGNNYLTITNAFEFSHHTKNILHGSANNLVIQSNANTTAFFAAPESTTSGKILYWNGNKGYEWGDPQGVDLSSTSTLNVDASRITSGLLPRARLGTSAAPGTYDINITGTAAIATSATTAGSAGSATTATNATNVVSGGTVVTGDSGAAKTVFGIKNNGHTSLSGRLVIGWSKATSSKYDDDDNAAIKCSGDIATSRDVWATNFNGVASSAKYADLAENYLADAKYVEGTIMMIGGKKEITAATKDKIMSVVGIVSTKPAYIMNSELKNGTMVGLKGRVPVRVIGKVKKGDMIIVSETPGVGIVSDIKIITPLRMIALKSKKTEEEGLVEVVIL